MRKWHQDRKVVRLGQIKPAHWIVRAANFIDIRNLFDDAASPMLDASGLMVDSVVRLSGTADGTVQMASAKSYLVQYGSGVADEANRSFQSAPLRRLDGGRVFADLTKLKKAAGSAPAASL